MVADLAPEKKAKGLQALADLDRTLGEFQDLIDAQNKQVGEEGARGRRATPEDCIAVSPSPPPARCPEASEGAVRPGRIPPIASLWGEGGEGSP